MRTLCIVILAMAIPFATRAQVPATLLMDGKRLQQIRNRAKDGDPSILSLTDSLKERANVLLKAKLLSVMDKSYTPVSGNKHDYMSQAPYFWYDSSRPNGLPYLRRDGEHNPEIKKITDRTYIGEVEDATQILALAWYITGEEKYASRASAFLTHWFLDESTRMNPNLDYAQGIPGITNGRGIGIIESRTLTGIADAAILLAGSTAWTPSQEDRLKQWYRDYLHWMLTSKNGHEEHHAKNNHGTWYYAQAIDFALFTGDRTLATDLVQESRKLLDSQLTAEGRWPLELARTNALGYSTFNTAAWFEVATLADHLGVDLWHYTTSKGASLRTAVDWLTPYALKEKKWSYQQIGPYDEVEFYPLLLQAAKQFDEKTYRQKAGDMTIQKQLLTELLYR